MIGTDPLRPADIRGPFEGAEALLCLQARIQNLGFRLPYNDGIAAKWDGYDRKIQRQYLTAWQSIPLSPEEVYALLTQELLQGEDKLKKNLFEIDFSVEDGQVRFVNINMSLGPKGDSSYSYINTSPIIDLGNGICKAVDVRSSDIKERGIGRKAVRNTFELSYRLGCPNIEVNASRTGSLLWLRENAFDITSINPNYFKAVSDRWSQLKPFLPSDLTEKIDTLMEAQDIRSLSEIDTCIKSALMDLGKDVYCMHDVCDASGNFPLGRFLLYDTNRVCWSGKADLRDPEKFEAVGRLVGGWSDEMKALYKAQMQAEPIALKPRAAVLSVLKAAAS